MHNIFCKVSYPFLTDKNDNRGLKFQLNKLLKSINYHGEHYWNIISLGFPDLDRSNILLEYVDSEILLAKYKSIFGKKNISNFNDMKFIDRILSLEGDLLPKVDRTSMLNSIECRAPFLNTDLWDFTKSLPEDYFIKGFNKKVLLKKSFENYFPKNFLNKKKHGFGIPVGNWIRTHFKKEILNYSNPILIENQGIFKIDDLNFLIKSHMKGEIDSTFKIWSFFCFQEWYFKVYQS